jgi:hypothetical protein
LFRIRPDGVSPEIYIYGLPGVGRSESVNEAFDDGRLLVVVLTLRAIFPFIILPFIELFIFIELYVFVEPFDIELFIGLFTFIELFVFIILFILVSVEQFAPNSASDKIADNVNVLVI